MKNSNYKKIKQIVFLTCIIFMSCHKTYAPEYELEKEPQPEFKNNPV